MHTRIFRRSSVLLHLTRNIISLDLLTSTMEISSFVYPPVKRDETVKDTYHGVEVSDPYRWLEDPDSEQTKAFINAQNSITKPYLESYPNRETLKKDLTEMWDYPRSFLPFRHGTKYFQRRNTGLQNQNAIYVQETLQSEPKIFLDPNGFSEDGTVSLRGTKFTEDGKTLAYGLSSGGSDWIEIKFRDVDTGKDYNDVLRKSKFTSMSWTKDGKGFFYCAYLDQEGDFDGSETQRNTNHKVYYHVLGTDQNQDIPIVSFEDSFLLVSACVSNCGDYLVVTSNKGSRTNCVYFADLKSTGGIIKGPLTLTPVVTVMEVQYQYVINTGSKFLFRTNKNAPNYKIVLIDFNNPGESNWVDLIPEHSKDVLEDCKAVNFDFLIVVYLRDVKHTLHLYKLSSGEKLKEFFVPIGTITGFSGRLDHTELFFRFTSFLTSSTIYRVDFAKTAEGEVEVFHETKVGGFKPEDFVSKQVFYESKDGTKIPMFILHRKDLTQDGSKPCLLFAYGGFNNSKTAQFSVARLIFVDKFHGVFALANIRGGGEYGRNWHYAGRLENKQNSFDDFQYAAKYLVRENYTSHRLLTIFGGSNGGLLVAACINQAPELFGAAICRVGALDMLRFHKFTIGHAWRAEYGSSEDSEQFKYLIKYSPLHNIKEPNNGAKFPATLVMTGDHDDRVVPLHSFKYISELQHKIGRLPHQSNPLMIRVETRAGHGPGKPTSKVIDNVVDYLCFMGRALGLKYYSN